MKPASPMKTVKAKPSRKSEKATSVRFRFQSAANPMTQRTRITPPISPASGETATYLPSCFVKGFATR